MIMSPPLHLLVLDDYVPASQLAYFGMIMSPPLHLLIWDVYVPASQLAYFRQEVATEAQETQNSPGQRPTAC